MFAFAILIGVYSYLIFILGITHLLYSWSVALVSIFWVVGVLFWYRKELSILSAQKKRLNFIHTLSPFSKLCVLLLLLLWTISFIGVLAPEISFDALWYHLTIPKIFVQNHQYFFIEGGLYYYSLMPKLIDMLYIPAVMAGSDTVAKMIHYSFGLLTLLALFQLSRRFLPLPLTLFVLVVFSSNLVVAWEATTAYVDLGRTFFEVMAVYGFILYLQEKKDLWLTESAVMVGFAISSKLIALTSLPLFILILLYTYKNNIKKGFSLSVRYVIIAMLIPFPYFMFSFLSSGNPLYPLFTEYYPQIIEPTVNIFTKIVPEYWRLFVSASDPINPLYLIVAPLLVLIFPKLKRDERLLVIYTVASLVVWYITPRTGGGRFILPYLPIFSLVTGIILSKISSSIIKVFVVGIGLIVAITTFGYRIIASMDEMKVVSGNQTRTEYLSTNLNYSFGDYYDVNGQISKIVMPTDTVLVYGIHNMYYADFKFIHESYVQPGDEFKYIIAPTNTKLPERFYAWKEIYNNPMSNISVYSQGGNTWVY